MLRKSNNVTVRRCNALEKSTLIIFGVVNGQIAQVKLFGSILYKSRDVIVRERGPERRPDAA